MRLLVRLAVAFALGHLKRTPGSCFVASLCLRRFAWDVAVYMACYRSFQGIPVFGCLELEIYVPAWFGSFNFVMQGLGFWGLRLTVCFRVWVSAIWSL